MTLTMTHRGFSCPLLFPSLCFLVANVFISLGEGWKTWEGMISGSGAINPQRSRESRLWIQEPDLSPLTYRNQLRKTLFQSVAPIFFFICFVVLSLRELFCFWSAVSELLSQHIRTNYSLRVDWSGERPEPAAVWNELSFSFMCATAKKSSGALPTPKASLKAARFFVHPGVPLQ